MIADDIADPKERQSGLARAEDIARAAQFQIALGDFETVRRCGERLQAGQRLIAGFRRMQKNAGGRSVAPSNAATQLMQLCEAEPLGLLDHHDCRVRYIDAHFDDGGRHENVDGARTECCHCALPRGGRQSAVDQADTVLREDDGVEFLREHGCALQVECFRFLDQRLDDEGLVARAQFGPHAVVGLVAAGHLPDVGNDRPAPGRTLSQFRDIEIPVRRRRERPGDRRRRHDELVRMESLRGKCRALHDAEAMLLVDDRETQIAERDVLLDQCVRPHHEARTAVRNAGERLAPGGRGERAGQQERREA